MDDATQRMFGLVTELRNGVLWYLGPYGSLIETVQSIEHASGHRSRFTKVTDTVVLRLYTNGRLLEAKGRSAGLQLTKEPKKVSITHDRMTPSA